MDSAFLLETIVTFMNYKGMIKLHFCGNSDINIILSSLIEKRYKTNPELYNTLFKLQSYWSKQAKINAKNSDMVAKMKIMFNGFLDGNQSELNLMDIKVLNDLVECHNDSVLQSWVLFKFGTLNEPTTNEFTIASVLGIFRRNNAHRSAICVNKDEIFSIYLRIYHKVNSHTMNKIVFPTNILYKDKRYNFDFHNEMCRKVRNDNNVMFTYIINSKDWIP